MGLDLELGNLLEICLLLLVEYRAGGDLSGLSSSIVRKAFRSNMGEDETRPAELLEIYLPAWRMGARAAPVLLSHRCFGAPATTGLRMLVTRRTSRISRGLRGVARA